MKEAKLNALVTVFRATLGYLFSIFCLKSGDAHSAVFRFIKGVEKPLPVERSFPAIAESRKKTNGLGKKVLIFGMDPISGFPHSRSSREE